MGWLLFLALAGAVLGGVAWIGRLDRGTTMLVGSALFVAAAGYAWQGSPSLIGAPKRTERHGLGADTPFASERQRLLERFGETAQWLSFADALNRMGEDQAAVTALGGAIAKHPRDVSLRIGYAHALLVLADYRLTPAVALAFSRAEAIAPDDPAPLYFEALAQFEASDSAAAERNWRALRDELPPASPWRGVIEEKLKLFDMMRAQAG
ncbi:tetratricopeptide repeat protein [Sphingomonas sp.]|uniref:tetratricopeptide repeat protein n=1 Tax=Sphingomonas sp. TaxID=28214 RepID=UPI003AFFF1A0